MILGDAQLSMLIMRADILAAFPFLNAFRSVAAGGGGCGGCKGGNRLDLQKRMIGVAGLKAAVLNMTAEQKAKLKQLLRVAHIVIFVSGPHGVDKKTL